MAADEITQKVSKYLLESFEEWRSREVARGHRNPSQRDFCLWLDVNETSFSAWIGAVRPPTPVNVDKIATRLGPKIYELMGLPPRMPNDRLFRFIASNWHKLNDQQKDEIIERMRNLVPNGSS